MSNNRINVDVVDNIFRVMPPVIFSARLDGRNLSGKDFVILEKMSEDARQIQRTRAYVELKAKRNFSDCH